MDEAFIINLADARAGGRAGGEERPMRQWDYLHCPPEPSTSSSARAQGRARC
jgi:hypothetical protein